MSNSKKWLLLAGVAGLVILTAAALAYPKLQQEWRAPLGPGLALPSYTPSALPLVLATPTTTPAASGKVSSQTSNPTAPPLFEAAAPTSTATSQPLCGGPAQMLVLAIGADSGQDYRYGLADVIRIVRVDFTIPKVSVLSLPRDLWVEIPDIQNPYGIDHGKLNQAYFYGGPGMGYYSGPGGGPGLLARTLEKNFGLRVDHYGAVNMQTFVKIVDAVGGLDIYLPTDVDGRPIDDKTEDMGYFRAGQQHFNGDQALRFSRIRKKYNDFTRMDHQNMVLCALKKKITSPEVLPKIPKIIAAFKDSVLTDLSLEQLSQFACLVPKLKRENLIFTSLPDELFQPGRVYSPQQKDQTFVLQADYDLIRDYIARFVAGTWPDQPDQPSCP